MASEAAKEWCERRVKERGGWEINLKTSHAVAYDAGAAAVLERLERVCDENKGGHAAALVIPVLDEILRRMREPA